MRGSDHISLLLTAGDGPAECRLAVAHCVTRMQQEGDDLGLSLSVHLSDAPHGPKSAVMVVHGAARERFAQRWCGTVQWRAPSPLRRHHKRANWFIGIFRLADVGEGQGRIATSDVRFSTLRAGGPGGQHQNTTDSAVRAVHMATGLTVVVREARSQHRNKALALKRLQSLSDAKAIADADAQKSQQNRLHHALERGNPIRRFQGAKFDES
ncbi:MAG: peptide chain release factor H [Sedimentitalea sp.]